MTSAVPNSDTEPAFADLDLPSALLDAVTTLGFTTPTQIQAAAIPALLAGRDITGIAQTGTGKTAAFGLPLISGIDADGRYLQAVVLTPTRELAIQVGDALQSFAQHVADVSVATVYGGAPYGPQIRALENGAQILVGTPGRVIDHLERGTADFSHVGMLVLDEADEMLRMGFAEDVDTIFAKAPRERQVALFSATMPPGIRRVAREHLKDPVEIAVARQSTTVSAVTQQFAMVPLRHKIGALSRVLITSEADAAIVFCRTRAAAEEVGIELASRGLIAATISGDVAQRDREKIVDRLRSGAIDVLVATDVAARGLDVERIGLVVNYDLPRESEAYVHRIGRTGRAGRAGTALTFISPRERGKLRNIERAIRTDLTEIQIPSPLDVSAHRTRKLLERVDSRLEAGRLGLYKELLGEYLAGHGDKQVEDVLSAVLALGVGDSGPSAQRAQEQAEHEELVAAARPPKTRARDDYEGSARRDRFQGEAGGRGPRRHFNDDAAPVHRSRPSTTPGATKYRVSVGFDTGAEPRGIVGALTNEGGLRGSDIGKIAMFGSFALVEIGPALDANQMKRLSRAKVGGRPLRLQVDDGPRPRTDRPRSERGERGGYDQGSRERGNYDRRDRGERGGDRFRGGDQGKGRSPYAGGKPNRGRSY
ncbi:DEAD/DEAH box helicase [Rarobacter faecitabidus]|uniref:DEAD/DEAH box helicase n=1 Tax=Rarobacter faecitabidus TaxID=13243 RepID=UPI001FE784D0|nr:DEAD/DEAH box helicase [Rarobacter faecitabidus]